MAETIKTPQERTPEQVEAQNAYNRKRSKWFACIIYPDEDPNHKKLIDYIESHRALFPSLVYICHDKDVDEEGNLKKAHTHLMFKRRAFTSPEAIVKFFGGWLKYCEAVSSPDAYILYMIHDMPVNDDDGKYKYPPNSLKGDYKVITEAIVQNAKCVQFFELLEVLKKSDFGTCEEVFEWIALKSEDEKALYLSVYKDYSHILNRLAVEIYRRKDYYYECNRMSRGKWHKVTEYEFDN